MKSKVKISAGVNVVCATLTCPPDTVFTLQPRASITVDGVTIQNHSNLFDLVFDITGIIVDPTPCKPLDWNQDHDYDHDGSAPLMGVSEINLVEAC
ncbi:MAG: hypothetical protein J0L79_02310 [Rickettsiales bacterium]|nr:hypothetical protein [Rickettsiales bacterium]MCA0254542.1 hypothetical protein [Pseudomonadota bacterium]